MSARRGRWHALESRRAPGDLTTDATIDTLGLYCPVPIIRTTEAIERIASGQVLEILSDDRVILIDMPAWCVSHGHEYLGYREDGPGWRLYVRRK